MKKTMINILILITFLGASAFALDDQCMLDMPIDMKGYDFYNYKFIFQDVVLDKDPIFKIENDEKSTLDMQIFNILINGSMDGTIGARIDKNDAARSSLGMSNSYNYRPALTEIKITPQGTLITTRERKILTDANGARYDGFKEIQILVNQDKILSIQFNLPVEKVENPDAHVFRMIFMNKYQTLCVRRAPLIGVIDTDKNIFLAF